MCVCACERACLCVRVGMYSSWCFQHKHAHTYTPTHAHVHVHVHADAHGGSMCGRRASADCLSSRPQATLPERQLDQRPAAGRVRRPYVASVSARALMRSASPLPPPRRSLCLPGFPFHLSFISPFIHPPPPRCICISSAHTLPCMHVCACMHTHTLNQSRVNIHMFVYSFIRLHMLAHMRTYICTYACVLVRARV